MELRHLKYFIAVAETENISRAALKLHVSQPALSRQVRDLEDELGFLLFEHRARTVRLTDAGRAFLEEARAVIVRADDAVRAARRVANGEGRELHIGYAPSLTARILPPALRAFQGKQPRVRVVWHDYSTEEMVAGLNDGRLDLAFLVRPARAHLRGLEFANLVRDPLRIAIARHHPLARRRSLTLAEVARYPLLAFSRKDYPEYHEMLESVFSHSFPKLNITEEHDSVTSLIAAIEAGNGVALTPQSVTCISGTRLKLVPITPAPEPLVVGAAWRSGQLSPTAELFLECCRQASTPAK